MLIQWLEPVILLLDGRVRTIQSVPDLKIPLHDLAPEVPSMPHSTVDRRRLPLPQRQRCMGTVIIDEAIGMEGSPRPCGVSLLVVIPRSVAHHRVTCAGSQRMARRR